MSVPGRERARGEERHAGEAGMLARTEGTISGSRRVEKRGRVVISPVSEELNS